jgi:ribosome-associated heat shock protein Hsp15
MRIDRLLWFLRLARTRGLAQQLVEGGLIRRNGQRVERAAQAVAPGDILTLPLGRGVLVIELVALPARRGPASEAQACYRVLDEVLPFPIAASQRASCEGTAKP